MSVGVLGSVGLMLYGGRHNSSIFLLVIFALWIVSPFAVFALASALSKRWTAVGRATLQWGGLLFTLVSLMIYTRVVFGQQENKPAFAFVIIPPVSWVGVAILVLFQSPWGRRIGKGLVALASIGLLGIVLLLVSLWIEHRMELTLPTPTGSFAVGRVVYDWVDNGSIDKLAPTPGTKRELLVWIWYPAATGQPDTIADYVPARLPMDKAPLTPAIFRLLTREPGKVHGHSQPDAAVSAQERAYPVVIMRTGASLETTAYSTLAEDLASHGYVVVGLDAPYRTGTVVFPDGRVMERTPENNPEFFENQPNATRLNELLAAWTSDMSFVLDRLTALNAADPSGKFTGRLDLTRVGAFGHSFGGAQAAQFCHDDPRCKAGIDIDGRPLGSVVQAGLHQPFLFLLSDQNTADAEGRQVMADLHSIYDRLPTDGRFLAKIRGAGHFFFSDDGGLLKSHILMGTLRALGMIHIDGRRQLAITAYCVHSFFDTYLKGANHPSLKLASPLYPELELVE
jgi:dienelactone hydrolase